MAVTVHCSGPQALLDKIKASIRAEKIVTWAIDSDGDLTHTAPQWANQAWFRAALHQDKLVFHILGTKNKKMTKSVYGVYHGRLIEMLLTHFDDDITRAAATSLPIAGDWISPTS
jgi:hypothetical protein